MQPIANTVCVLTALSLVVSTFSQVHYRENDAMNRKAVYDFVDAINAHDVERICALMTDDHAFIDSHGNVSVGKETMRAAWTGYFAMFPDYAIEVTEIFSNGDTLAAFGYAGGTFLGKKTVRNENYWRLPASWKAVVRDDKIQLWQVYCDAKIPFDIINKNK